MNHSKTSLTIYFFLKKREKKLQRTNEKKLQRTMQQLRGHKSTTRRFLSCQWSFSEKTLIWHIIPNFQISTSAHLILVKMAPHVLILLQVTVVIAQKDILETIVKQVRTTQEGYFFQCIFSTLTWIYYERYQDNSPGDVTCSAMGNQYVCLGGFEANGTRCLFEG